LCPRECHIKEGSRGFCFVRANVEGELVLTTYGRSSGFCIDPIEKKPLNHFLPGTPILSLGTAGCNLGCKFCQNWDISKSREMDTLAGQAGPEAIVQAAKQTGCRSIAFTYNDPTIWAEYAIDTAKIARAENIRTVAVTAGYISPEPRVEFYHWMDAANIDLKAFTEVFYRKLTQTQLAPVLDTLKYLKHETDVWFEITNLMIPTENDSIDETREMCDWIVKELGPDVPVHFTAFHPDFKMRDLPRTPHETLIRARAIAIDCGIQYAYVGNVNDRENQSTYCHECGNMVVERDWYELGTYALRGNTCKHCGATIPGIYDEDSETPGDWGRKRQPIGINDPRQYISVSTSALNRALADPEQDDNVMQSSEPEESVEQPAPRLDFDESQQKRLLEYVRDQVRIAVAGAEPSVELSADLADAPAWGLFVTLKRAGQLRACRGRWGQTASLGELLTQVTRDTAVNDVRFARITPQEIDRLDIDLSLMHSPEALAQKGADLISAVKVGVHGLVIAHARGRGLLLPNVPIENGWDTQTYLCQLCAKAGLPQDTWLTDASTQIMTFQTLMMMQHASQPDFDIDQLTVNRLAQLCDLAGAVFQERAEPTIADEVLNQEIDQEMGIQIHAPGNAVGTSLGAGLSLIDLTRNAATSLRQFCLQQGAEPRGFDRLVVLHQSIRLRAADYPNRHGLLAYNAVLAESEQGWALALPQAGQQNDMVGQAMQAVGLDYNTWKNAQEKQMVKPRLTAFNALFQSSKYRPGGLDKREPFRAGQFYPRELQSVKADVAAYLREGQGATRRDARAVMLPHAGWTFCGKTMGKTLGHVNVPDTVIIVGPKHTAFGVNWSVPPHRQWDLPGLSVPIDTEIVGQLLDAIPGLRCDVEAHQQEHAVEVIIPFLHALNPNIQVVPMVIGQCNFEQVQMLGKAIRSVVDRAEAAGRKILLVISSDMNHFATEQRSHVLDKLALDAMCSGDAKSLFDTCMAEQISMCGVRPAAIIMEALSKGEPSLIKPELIHYTTSAEASGDTSRVVGYAGVVID